MANKVITLIDADGVRYPLTLAENSQLVAGALGLEGSPVELHRQPRPTGGDILSAVRAPSKTVMLPVHFRSVADMVELAEAIIGRACRLEHARDGQVRELLEVYYVEGLEGDDSREMQSASWRRRTIEMVALDPYWYSVAKSATLEPGVDITAGLGWNEAISWNAAVAWNGGSIITLDVDSRVGAWPVFSVVGPTTFFEIVHLRTGQAVRLRDGFTVATGQTMIIDSRPATRDITMGGLQAWTHVTPESDPALEVRLNDQLAIVMQGTSGASEIQVSFRERWRMP